MSTAGAVGDDFGVRADAALPCAAAALDAVFMGRRLGALAGPVGASRLDEIRVVRHKPGKRCVIEYCLRAPDGEAYTLLGKMRSSHRADTAFKLMQAFRAAGFDDAAADGICVAEPVACFADLGMWLQCKVAGRVAAELLAGPDAPALAAWIAEADHKIQRAGVRTRREHGMADELRILDERLMQLAAAQPPLAARIARLLAACRRRAAGVRDPVPRGIHRDFYADQLIVAGARLYVIDFDLYCSGDPALDMGNFIGHVVEQALREHGGATALDAVAQAGRMRFLELAAPGSEAALDAYADLTLVRHIYLSSLFGARRHLTGALLTMCEERFAPWLQ
jgi:aminoglycoside phosphotransferase (APT) family kinase protein